MMSACTVKTVTVQSMIRHQGWVLASVLLEPLSIEADCNSIFRIDTFSAAESFDFFLLDYELCHFFGKAERMLIDKYSEARTGQCHFEISCFELYDFILSTQKPDPLLLCQKSCGLPGMRRSKSLLPPRPGIFPIQKELSLQRSGIL